MGGLQPEAELLWHLGQSQELPCVPGTLAWPASAPCIVHGMFHACSMHGLWTMQIKHRPSSITLHVAYLHVAAQNHFHAPCLPQSILMICPVQGMLCKGCNTDVTVLMCVVHMRRHTQIFIWGRNTYHSTSSDASRAHQEHHQMLAVLMPQTCSM